MERSRRGVAARERKRIEVGPARRRLLPRPVSWRVTVQEPASGVVVTMDLVPARALGLGRANQWTVVLNESVLWRTAMGLAEFWNSCRLAAQRHVLAERAIR